MWELKTYPIIPVIQVISASTFDLVQAEKGRKYFSKISFRGILHDNVYVFQWKERIIVLDYIWMAYES